MLEFKDIQKIAKLSRLQAEDRMVGELNGILKWIDELQKVDVSHVNLIPDTSMHERDDIVTDGNQLEAILSNAPASFEGLFCVPKVIE
jgi:aspartyl-tRNA(Asn)/glutamyl-tRNA(Gln) amidotransferase subunit C